MGNVEELYELFGRGMSARGRTLSHCNNYAGGGRIDIG